MSNKTRRVDTRFTPKQYDIMIHRKESLGYVSTSQYMRDCSMKEDFSVLHAIKRLEEKIDRISEKVMEIEK